MKITKKQVVGFVKGKLISDSVWALRALEVVFKNQTLIEQNSQRTIEHNGIGFTGVDAEFLSSLHEQYKRYGRLTCKQMSFVHKMIPKYHGQVIQASKESGKYEALLNMIESNLKG